ncbi:MAG TPA: hypothetical protein VGY66_11795 [Gemmataceae bacterium]|nr:hypothetical protein [Gemmataceae bacterium]
MAIWPCSGGSLAFAVAMHQLAVKNQEGLISQAELAELDNYIEIMLPADG